MMTQVKRSKWFIRLSLLTLLLLFASIPALLLSTENQAISPSAAKILLEQWQATGSSSGYELESILGSPTEVRMTNKGKKLSWLFEPESLFDIHQFWIVADINNEDHVFGMVVGE